MKLTGRKIKKDVHQILADDNFDSRINELLRIPLMPLINALFSFLFGMDCIKDRAVMVMGIAVSILADQDIEAARIVMRRLMWSLNDESGGIGWGAPEAMAEIMANQRTLADEFHHILMSYAMQDGNYLEHTELQKGVQKGIQRLKNAWPDLVQ